MLPSDENMIALLNNVTIQLNRYLSIIIYLFGTIGNILNILVLSQRALRSNSCAFLFLISSIACLIDILSGLTSRMISAWTTDLTNTIDWICKFRGIILFTSRTIALWLITLATIDRWLLSCIQVHRRQLSTLKNARRCTIIIFIFSFLLNAPLVYCLQSNVIDAPLKCYSKTTVCRIYTDMVYGCGSILIPCLLMTYFSLMIILNVRRTQRRIDILHVSRVGNQSMNTIRTQRTKKKDRQFLFMLFVQIVFFILLTFPQAIQKIYSTMTLYFNTSSKSLVQKAIENFLFNFVILLTYFASGLPFYIYTMSGGSVFRNACWKLLRSTGRKIICRNT